jgi:hypothetical protein
MVNPFKGSGISLNSSISTVFNVPQVLGSKGQGYNALSLLFKTQGLIKGGIEANVFNENFSLSLAIAMDAQAKIQNKAQSVILHGHKDRSKDVQTFVEAGCFYMISQSGGMGLQKDDFTSIEISIFETSNSPISGILLSSSTKNKEGIISMTFKESQKIKITDIIDCSTLNDLTTLIDSKITTKINLEDQSARVFDKDLQKAY